MSDVYTLRNMIGQLREALESCAASDRSRPYDYHEAREDGKRPRDGERWLTPREIAEKELKYLDDFERDDADGCLRCQEEGS